MPLAPSGTPITAKIELVTDTAKIERDLGIAIGDVQAQMSGGKTAGEKFLGQASHMAGSVGLSKSTDAAAYLSSVLPKLIEQAKKIDVDVLWPRIRAALMSARSAVGQPGFPPDLGAKLQKMIDRTGVVIGGMRTGTTINRTFTEKELVPVVVVDFLPGAIRKLQQTTVGFAAAPAGRGGEGAGELGRGHRGLIREEVGELSKILMSIATKQDRAGNLTGGLLQKTLHGLFSFVDKYESASVAMVTGWQVAKQFFRRASAFMEKFFESAKAIWQQGMGIAFAPLSMLSVQITSRLIPVFAQVSQVVMGLVDKVLSPILSGLVSFLAANPKIVQYLFGIWLASRMLGSILGLVKNIFVQYVLMGSGIKALRMAWAEHLAELKQHGASLGRIDNNTFLMAHPPTMPRLPGEAGPPPLPTASVAGGGGLAAGLLKGLPRLLGIGMGAISAGVGLATMATNKGNNLADLAGIVLPIVGMVTSFVSPLLGIGLSLLGSIVSSIFGVKENTKKMVSYMEDQSEWVQMVGGQEAMERLLKLSPKERFLASAKMASQLPEGYAREAMIRKLVRIEEGLQTEEKRRSGSRVLPTRVSYLFPRIPESTQRKSMDLTRGEQAKVFKEGLSVLGNQVGQGLSGMGQRLAQGLLAAADLSDLRSATRAH